MLKTKFFIGDKVVNLKPHFDNNNKLIRLNDTGHINVASNNECEVTWQIREYPFYTVTRVSDLEIDSIL